MTSSTRPRVALSRRLPAAVELALAERYDVCPNVADLDLGEDGLREALRSSDAVVTTVTDRLPRALLTDPRRRARLVAQFGVGVDRIDLHAAREAGILVTNTPGVLTEDTADLAILLLLATARRAGEAERELRAGRWSGWRPTHMLGTRVHGKTLGVVGYGRIGRAVARRARFGFGMRVLAWAPRPVGPDESLDAVAPSLDELLAASDFVTLHCPSSPETRHLMDERHLAHMRSHAMLVNTARGEVVDEGALCDALDAGRLAGAGLDVYEREPEVPPRLLAHERVVVLPHIGSATLETRVAMGMRVVSNLDAFFRGEVPPDRVA
jgi:lactate dehydrogenase-like 2-hydroxyacid dehydrogenase